MRPRPLGRGVPYQPRQKEVQMYDGTLHKQLIINLNN
jgi:hypothetical protein